jgi:NAD(P)-dependent dehydrogenase (short-subunit alcohol dehydrogenase family)
MLVLITGAFKGIGLETLKYLLSHPHNVLRLTLIVFILLIFNKI